MSSARWGPGRRVAAACLAAAAVAAGVTGYVLSRPDHHVRSALAVATPVVTYVAPAQVPSMPASTPAPAPVIPHDVVAAAAPTSFLLTGRGFRIAARVCAMAPVFPLDPPGDQHHTVCWVTKGFGVAPGSSSGTSYVLGHSWAPDANEVLNRMSEPATRDVLKAKPQRLDGVPVFAAPSMLGARITLRTAKGVLVYSVRQAFGVDKLKLGNIARIVDQHIRNRVVVITCAERNGVDYDYNIVLDARLISSRSTSAIAG